jgi:2-oxoglutarate/2-oxoacid ferredoxin oxidoreductase subunit alpha
VPEPRLLQGNQACVEGALAAGCRFYAGYPITPSSEIAEGMARKLPPLGGAFIQMEDEMASLAAVIGASLGGRKAMTATSGPGFSLMQEHLGFAALAEVPCVVVDVMRGGPSTGLPTSPSQGDVMQARWGSHGDRPAIVLAPASVQEVFELTVAAFNLAEQLRTPVILAYDEVIGHLRELAVLPDGVRAEPRGEPDRPAEGYLPYAPGRDGVARPASFGTGYRYHVTGLMHDRRGLPTENPEVVAELQARLNAKPLRAKLPEPEEVLLEDAEVAVVAYGITARAADEALQRLRGSGVRAGMLRLRTLWPFPEQAVARLGGRVRSLLVAEMNLGQMVREVERAVAGEVPVRALLRADGRPITPEQVVEAAA